MHQDHKYIIFSTTALNFLNMLKIEITDYCMKNLAPEVASFSNGFYIYYYITLAGGVMTKSHGNLE